MLWFRLVRPVLCVPCFVFPCVGCVGVVLVCCSLFVCDDVIHFCVVLVRRICFVSMYDIDMVCLLYCSLCVSFRSVVWCCFGLICVAVFCFAACVVGAFRFVLWSVVCLVCSFNCVVFCIVLWYQVALVCCAIYVWCGVVLCIDLL